MATALRSRALVVKAPPARAVAKPPPLPPLAALSRPVHWYGMLLPLALLAATRPPSTQPLSRACASSLILGGLAAGLSTARTLRTALLAALVAALCGLAGGLSDSLRLLTASTFVSTLATPRCPSPRRSR